jgi:hypothetical protein
LRRRDLQLDQLLVGAVKNGTATLSYCDELARIPIYAQAPISRCSEILLQNRIHTGHFRNESLTQAARFLFFGGSTERSAFDESPGHPGRSEAEIRDDQRISRQVSEPAQHGAQAPSPPVPLGRTTRSA